jgi:hypothetical protein
MKSIGLLRRLLIWLKDDGRGLRDSAGLMRMHRGQIMQMLAARNPQSGLPGDAVIANALREGILIAPDYTGAITCCRSCADPACARADVPGCGNGALLAELQWW